MKTRSTYVLSLCSLALLHRVDIGFVVHARHLVGCALLLSERFVHLGMLGFRRKARHQGTQAEARRGEGTSSACAYRWDPFRGACVPLPLFAELVLEDEVVGFLGEADAGVRTEIVRVVGEWSALGGLHVAVISRLLAVSIVSKSVLTAASGVLVV